MNDLDRLLAAGHRYDFVQVVSLLQRAARGAAPVGRQGPASREAIRFRAHLDLGFPTSEVAGVQRLPSPDGGAERFQVTTTGLGIYGANAPMPTYFSEALIAQDEASPARAFIDLFHHRMLSLLYRVLTKYRAGADGGGGSTAEFIARLRALIGSGEGATPAPGAAPAPDDASASGPSAAPMAYAGLIAQQPRSAASLETMLADHLAVPVEVEQCVAAWSDLPDDQRARLGAAGCAFGAACAIGERVLNRGSTFRVTIGPLDGAAFAGFLPGGDRHDELRGLVSLFNPDDLDCDVVLVISAADLPPARLGPPGPGAPALGRNARAVGEDAGYYETRFVVRGW